jgi:hypothetical protein
MKLDTMLLANYAEDQGGLLYIMGGGWDTITGELTHGDPGLPRDSTAIPPDRDEP